MSLVLPYFAAAGPQSNYFSRAAIHDMICPPKVFPMWLVCGGKTSSVKVRADPAAALVPVLSIRMQGEHGPCLKRDVQTCLCSIAAGVQQLLNQQSICHPSQS